MNADATTMSDHTSLQYLNSLASATSEFEASTATSFKVYTFMRECKHFLKFRTEILEIFDTNNTTIMYFVSVAEGSFHVSSNLQAYT